MEIASYDLYTVPPRWVFLRLETDEGVVGWGEPAVEGRSGTLCSAVGELVEDYLLGENPLEVERLWSRMFRGDHYRGGPVLMSAIAGIDQALWDIKGRHWDAPVYELLGGPVREKLRLFQWISGDQPRELADAAERALEQGYTAFGMMAHGRPARLRTSDVAEKVEERISVVQDTLGSDGDLAVDFRGRVSAAVAKRLLSRLEKFDLMFVEEPVLPEYNDRLPELSAATDTPLATGQRMYSRWDFKELVRNGAVDVVQPSLPHAGGITEVRKIGTMVEPFDVSLMPKSPVGPIAFASAIHVGLATTSVVFQEQHDEFYASPNNEFFNYVENNDFFSIADGFMEVDDRPGLGIEIDREYVETQAQKNVGWKGPTWHHEDGSIANW